MIWAEWFSECHFPSTDLSHPPPDVNSLLSFRKLAVPFSHLRLWKIYSLQIRCHRLPFYTLLLRARHQTRLYHPTTNRAQGQPPPSSCPSPSQIRKGVELALWSPSSHRTVKLHVPTVHLHSPLSPTCHLSICWCYCFYPLQSPIAKQLTHLRSSSTVHQYTPHRLSLLARRRSQIVERTCITSSPAHAILSVHSESITLSAGVRNG